MSLEKWAEYDWLKAEPPSPNEIANLLSIVVRALADARVDAISDDLRFQAAFSAALTAANIALRASGYRTKVQSGHHQKIVESLEYTLASDPRLIHKLRTFSRKRNATSYDAAGGVSEQDLAEAIKLANELHRSVIDWLTANHRELLPGT
jgi:hypothetical protein